MTLASFIPSVTGMNAMSHAQQTVAENIANMNTTGYKQNETLFYSLLGSSGLNVGTQSGLSSSRVSIDGVGCYDRTNIGIEGTLQNTGNVFDVALNGNSNAFFTLDDGYGNIYYTRAGDFTKLTQNDVTYLVSSSGLFVQGFQAIDNGDGGFSTTASDIVVDAPQTIPQKETTQASIIANVPANDVDKSVYSIRIYSNNYDGANLNMVLEKIEGRENSWALSFELEDGTAVGNTTEVIFNTDGTIKTPENIDVAIAWNDGSTSNVNVDISKMTQYGESSQVTKIEQNGFPSGNLLSVGFDDEGVLRAYYSNDNDIAIAQLAITGFTAPENLTPYNNTLFEANGETGNSYYVDPDGIVVAESLENSSVDIEKEFSQMIIVQRAYSLNAQSFTVNDEMLSVLIDLKS